MGSSDQITSEVLEACIQEMVQAISQSFAVTSERAIKPWIGDPRTSETVFLVARVRAHFRAAASAWAESTSKIDGIDLSLILLEEFAEARDLLKAVAVDAAV